MAKQRGIHQVSGKIDNLVYYEQKRVPVGLIRRQNQAMSERLKSDPTFAKTRAAGSEFGYCSNLASIIIRSIPMRAQRILDPFILPQFTKYLYSLLKNTDGVVGHRFLDNFPALGRDIENYINRLPKQMWDGIFPQIRLPRSVDIVNFLGEITIDKLEVQQFCDLFGYDGIRFSFYDFGSVKLGEYIVGKGYTKSQYISYRYKQRILITKEDTRNLTQEVEVASDFGQLTSVLVLAEPMRLVGNTQTYPLSHRSFIFKYIQLRA